VLIFGAKDFELLPGKIDDKGAAGRIHTKAPTTFSGATLEFDATFDAAITTAVIKAPAASAAAASGPDRSAALNQLLLKHLTFTPADFLTAVSGQEVETVRLYLDAGMSPDTPGGSGTRHPPQGGREIAPRGRRCSPAPMCDRAHVTEDFGDTVERP
jgi:hypothetical protein